MLNNARVIVWDGIFNQEELPKVTLNRTPPIPSASLDWVVDSLPLGGVASWTDSINGLRFVADGSAPVVKEEAEGKYLSFDGNTSRMGVNTPMNEAHTIVAVYRFRAPAAGSIVHYGRSGSGAGWVATGGGGATVNSGGSGRFIVPNPQVAPDAKWHVAILTIDGTDSAFRLDDKETSGNITVGARDGITLGFASGGTGRTAIDYKRISIIPGSMDSSTRGALSKYLDTVHKIGAQ